jgi:hypothetical protein
MRTPLLITITLLLFTFSSCKKSSDLTTQVVGKYTKGSGSGLVDITVNKVDDKTVTIAVDEAAGGEYAFTSVKMNSETSFNLNSITISGRHCDGQETISGTGTVSGNNISLFYTNVVTGVSGSPYSCTAGTFQETISASK